MTYTDKQMTELTMEIDAISDLIQASETILFKELKGDIKSKNRVYNVDFSMPAEFERIKNSKLKLPEILSIYHDWAYRTYMLCIKNRGKLKSGPMRKIILERLEMVKTINVIFS